MSDKDLNSDPKQNQKEDLERKYKLLPPQISAESINSTDFARTGLQIQTNIESIVKQAAKLCYPKPIFPL